MGKEPNGTFKTSKAQEYPPEFCYIFAQILVNDVVAKRQQAGGLRQIRTLPMAEVEFRAEEKERREGEKIKLRMPGCDPLWCVPKDWELVVKEKWRFEEHNNITEARTGLWAVRRAARSMKHWGKRMLIFTDSLVTLGAFTKGRSSSWGLLRQCRKLAAFTLGLGMSFSWRYVPTDLNMADGPSRDCPVGVAPKKVGCSMPKQLFKEKEEASGYGKEWQGFG